MSCPKCGRVFNSDQIVKLLEDFGVTKETLKAVTEAVNAIDVVNMLG